jgi:hypothetical protein
MKTAYESYSLGLRLSHLAMLRNLGRFVDLAERGGAADANFPAFVSLFVKFLDPARASRSPPLRRP